VCLGTNDADPSIWDKWKAAFAADYAAMVEVFARLPSKPRIWLCQPPPMFFAADDIRTRTLSGEVIPAIRKIAADGGWGVIDWYAALDGQRALFMADGVHPLPAGAEAMAREACKALAGKASKTGAGG
jgi:acyl-CoA thioesterase I